MMEYVEVDHDVERGIGERQGLACRHEIILITVAGQGAGRSELCR
jgi:hypothetical protein